MLVSNAVSKISDFVNRLCCIFCTATLTSMVILTIAQIVSRVFFTALTWSEEATQYLLVWSTFIGGSVVYKNAGHISVTLLRDMFPKAVQSALKLVVQLVCGAFCAIAIYYGLKYMKLQGNQLSAALRVPMRYMYMSIPIGFGIMEIHVLDSILSQLFRKEAAAE